MLCGHINEEITSSHKVQLVSLLQDLSESLTHGVCAKSPGESHRVPDSTSRFGCGNLVFIE